MRYLIVVFLLAVSAIANAEQFVFVRDNEVACKPRDLPSVGVRVDTGDVVFGLHSASAGVRQACGWYLVEEDQQAPEGMRIGSRLWVVENGMAYLKYTYEPIPPKSYELSKYLLVDQIAAAGKLPQFMAWLDADPTVRFRWDAATTLDDDNIIIQAATVMLPEVLGLSPEQIAAIMKGARVNP